MTNKTTSILLQLIGPTITIIVLVIGFITAYNKTTLFTDLNKDELKVHMEKSDKTFQSVQDNLVRHDQVLLKHSAQIDAIDAVQKPIAETLKEVQKCLKELQLNTAVYQAEVSSDLKYIKSTVKKLENGAR